MRINIYVFLFCLIGRTFNLNAQSYIANYNAYSTGGNCYVLTDEVKNERGSLWFTQKLDLSKSFDISFTMNFATLMPTEQTA